MSNEAKVVDPKVYYSNAEIMGFDEATFSSLIGKFDELLAKNPVRKFGEAPPMDRTEVLFQKARVCFIWSSQSVSCPEENKKKGLVLAFETITACANPNLGSVEPRLSALNKNAWKLKLDICNVLGKVDEAEVCSMILEEIDRKRQQRIAESSRMYQVIKEDAQPEKKEGGKAKRERDESISLSDAFLEPPGQMDQPKFARPADRQRK